MEAMQATGNLSWIEVQFAKHAVDTVIAARITLKWSYCMAFYLERNNMTELFEDNQRDLEAAVEDLGHLLEQNPDVASITKHRQDITNKSVSMSLGLVPVVQRTNTRHTSRNAMTSSWTIR